jgi:hypothetical protein
MKAKQSEDRDFSLAVLDTIVAFFLGIGTVFYMWDWLTVTKEVGFVFEYDLASFLAMWVLVYTIYRLLSNRGR